MKLFVAQKYVWFCKYTANQITKGSYPCYYQIETKYVRKALKINLNERAFLSGFFSFTLQIVVHLFLSFIFLLSVFHSSYFSRNQILSISCLVLHFQLESWIFYFVWRIQQKKTDEIFFVVAGLFINGSILNQNEYEYFKYTIYFEMKFERTNKCKASKFAFHSYDTKI